MRKKYDTSVVFLYASGNEHLLPEEFRKQIPYSTISTWRKIDLSKYLGNEYRAYFDEAFEKATLYDQNKKLRRTLFALSEVVPGSGRYISADGTKVVRMGASDITGAHGGGPHLNFETLVPNPSKPGKVMVDQNIHIFIKD